MLKGVEKMCEMTVKAVKDNMLYMKNGEVWAYYRLQSEHKSVIDDLKKEKNKRKMTLFFDELKDYKDNRYKNDTT